MLRLIAAGLLMAVLMHYAHDSFKNVERNLVHRQLVNESVLDVIQ
jgi:hypothetical protein